jgi:hypothetical protein
LFAEEHVGPTGVVWVERGDRLGPIVDVLVVAAVAVTLVGQPLNAAALACD